MGMFDYLNFKGHQYQSKDTPRQVMDQYEIREDGTLWVHSYDCEWVEDKNDWLGGRLNHFNYRWEQLEGFTGEIVFYRNLDKEYKIWEEYSAYFVKGKLMHLEPIGDTASPDA